MLSHTSYLYPGSEASPLLGFCPDCWKLLSPPNSMFISYLLFVDVQRYYTKYIPTSQNNLQQKVMCTYINPALLSLRFVLVFGRKIGSFYGYFKNEKRKHEHVLPRPRPAAWLWLSPPRSKLIVGSNGSNPRENMMMGWIFWRGCFGRGGLTRELQAPLKRAHSGGSEKSQRSHETDLRRHPHHHHQHIFSSWPGDEGSKIRDCCGCRK